MKEEEISKLSKLCRLKLGNEEIKNYASDIAEILTYVGQIKSAPISKENMENKFFVIQRNVMREDGEQIKSEKYTDKILKNAPEAEKGFIKVKKII